MFDFSVIAYAFPLFLRGAIATMLFCSLATAVGLVLGTVIALGRLSKRRILRGLSLAFIEPFRNTPFLVQAFLIYFGLAQFGFRMSAPVAGAVILCLYGTALFAEAIRGSIESVPKGQLEAARAVGMPYLTAMRRIVFPQTIGYLIPVLTNLIIGLIKDSAALSIITVPELAMAAQRVVGETFRPIEAYLFVAVVYWMLTTSVARGLLAFQARHSRRRAQLAHAMPSPSAGVPTPQIKQD
jgi:polar amino acid transport system permease protein